MVPDPLPLAYSLYAFINVENYCERPLSQLINVFLKKQVIHIHSTRGTLRASEMLRGAMRNGDCTDK